MVEAPVIQHIGFSCSLTGQASHTRAHQPPKKHMSLFLSDSKSKKHHSFKYFLDLLKLKINTLVMLLPYLSLQFKEPFFSVSRWYINISLLKKCSGLIKMNQKGDFRQEFSILLQKAALSRLKESTNNPIFCCGFPGVSPWSLLVFELLQWNFCEGESDALRLAEGMPILNASRDVDANRNIAKIKVCLHLDT